MSITIKEIAKLAEVSRGTVDRALNNRGRVAPDVKSKILRIADQYGYKKNIIASQLAKSDSKYVGVILPDPYSDPYWSLPMEGINQAEKIVGDYGLNLVKYPFSVFDVKTYIAAIDAAIREKVDAIILAPTFAKEASKYIRLAEQNDIPVVIIDSEIQSQLMVSYIGQDCHQSGKVAGRLLYDADVTDGVIYAITIGSDSLSGNHTNQKLEGLSNYIADQDVINIIDHRVIEIVDDFESIAKLSKVIAEDPKVIGIFFTNSRAYHFFEYENADLASQHIKIVGYDLLAMNVELLQNDKISYLLNQNPHKQSYYAVLSLFDYFVHGKPLNSKEYLAIDIIIKENCDYYLSSQNRTIRMR